jgi:prephenate dehydrogenase
MDDKESEFERVAIVGTGLMGGSLGLAVKHFYSDKTVTGVDFPEETAKALERGAIDEGYGPGELESALEGADLVVLATPIDRILELLGELPEYLSGKVAVMDLGSTKRKICARGWEKLKDSPATFIGGHPMTGAEVRGITGAHSLLFENSVFVLVTPDGEPTDVSAKLEGFLEGVGADPCYLDARTHDRIVARVSHLPQLISIGLMKTVGRAEDPENYLSLAGGGFRDMTRIAESPFEIWEDIFSTNGELIREEVEKFLRKTEETLEDMEKGTIESDFRESGSLRDQLPRSSKGISSSTFKVAVMIPDRPGALAEMTAGLAEEGVNIRDIELQKVREDYGGTFHVYFDSFEAAKEAEKIMNEQGFESRVVD